MAGSWAGDAPPQPRRIWLLRKADITVGYRLGVHNTKGQIISRPQISWGLRFRVSDCSSLPMEITSRCMGVVSAKTLTNLGEHGAYVGRLVLYRHWPD